MPYGKKFLVKIQVFVEGTKSSAAAMYVRHLWCSIDRRRYSLALLF